LKTQIKFETVSFKIYVRFLSLKTYLSLLFFLVETMASPCSRAVVAVIAGTLVLSYLRAFNNYPVGTLCSDDKNVPATALTPKNLTTVECLARLPKWILDGRSNTLRDEFVLGSDGLTDKSTAHTYQLVYHRYLATRGLRACLESPQKKPKFRMLEIGLGCAPGGGMRKGEPGGSTRAWHHLFPGDAFDLDLHVMEYDAKCAMDWVSRHPGIATMIHCWGCSY